MNSLCLLVKIKKEWYFPYKNALIISIVLCNFNVHRVLVDDGSVVNILSKDALIQIGVDTTKLIPL